VKVPLGPVVLNLGDTSSAGTVWIITVAAVWLGQSYFIATRGQSVGKMLLKTRIVALDGSPASFVKAVLLRTWLFILIAQVPWAGGGSVLGALLIFGPDRRCLHDYVAGTRVVLASHKARPPPGDRRWSGPFAFSAPGVERVGISGTSEFGARNGARMVRARRLRVGVGDDLAAAPEPTLDDRLQQARRVRADPFPEEGSVTNPSTNSGQLQYACTPRSYGGGRVQRGDPERTPELVRDK
jgi:uncharacterized RDD family membrane protein YckC